MSCVNCSAKEILNKANLSNELAGDACGKLDSYDWLNDLPIKVSDSAIVEIRFKNTRKEFFLNKNKLQLKRGDYVAVAATQGHDVGQVTLTGKVALLQLNRKNLKSEPDRLIYRKATPADIENWNKTKQLEKPVMIKARQWVEKLGLDMKISDVEYQADGTKATFYYIADGRVDFRELIKHYAKSFGIKVEMRQIGARQEAAMVGGIGSCGKELCCSSWRSNLDSVSAHAAKIQNLPHNVQKLTGQCGKLKCCLMYELDSYLDAQKDFPDVLLELETEQGIAYPKKKEVLKQIIWYSLSENDNSRLFPLSLDKVKEIILLNKKGKKAALLSDSTEIKEPEYMTFQNDFSVLKKTNKGNSKRKPKNNQRKKNNRQRDAGKESAK
jgi:cell fate regulator YaaT (PSP1 superfamily)